MAAITPGNLIIYDFLGADDLNEYGIPPDYSSPVQAFTLGIPGFHNTQRANGNVVSFPANGFFDVPEIDKDTGVDSVLASDTDAWGDTSDPVDITRVQNDTNSRINIIYKENTNGDINAKRLTDAAIADEIITLEAAFADEVISGAFSPSGQYAYLLLTPEAIADDWVATLYEYDLDNAGARTELKQYTMPRPANPSIGGGLALGCDHDGNLYVGYYSTDFVASGIPGETHARYTYYIDKLDPTGTVLDTWQVHQYTNTNQFDPTGAPGGDTASNDGYAPLFTISREGILWGMFYRHFAFDTSTPTLADTRLIEVDTSTGNVDFHDWFSDDSVNGLFQNIWPFEPIVYQGLQRMRPDTSVVWFKDSDF